MHLRPLGHLSNARPDSAVVEDGSCSGGESGIRTHGTLAGTPDFESGTFGHSVISPPANLANASRPVKPHPRTRPPGPRGRGAERVLGLRPGLASRRASCRALTQGRAWRSSEAPP